MRRSSVVSLRVRRAVVAPVLALALFGTQAFAGASAGFVIPALAAANRAQPNRFDPKSTASSTLHRPPASTAKSAPAPGRYAPPREISVPMRPARAPVDPVDGAHFLGSDGVFEFDVPAGAVTRADVAAAGGSMTLLVRQVLPASGSSAGGSGHYSFGTYLVQLLDASGRPARQGLRQPFTARLHHDQRARALDVRHAEVLINPSLPAWFDLNPPAVLPALVTSSGASPTTAPAQRSSAGPSTPGAGVSPAKLGPASHQAATVDTVGSSLSAVAPMISSTTGVSFGTDSPVATFGKPDPFEVGLSGGALSARYPIDVPAGPGGFTPPVNLSYNSAGVTDQHNPQGAAPWAGEGWNLSFGAISWAEHQVFSTCGSCTPQWEDSWQLADPLGTGADLVPPNINVSTYNDDTGQGITPGPITWHTAPETRDKVISFNSSNTLPGSSALAPCFRIWLPSGTMEEYGCTAGSLQWYPQPTGTNSGKAYIANWLLDLITDPSGNQVHVTYQQDVATAGGVSYPRDVVPATVEYDSPGCLNAQAACTGGGWAPLMRVNFVASHSVGHVNGSSCPANGSLRCDDPADLSGSGGLAAPTVQGTFVLNDVQVQARAGATATWNTLRDYQMSYDQSGPSQITDPVSGLQESIAGRLNLTQLREIGADAATSMPASVFQYAQITSYYEDSLGAPNPSTNCGPSWNNGNTPNGHTGCVLWSQSYGANSSYLSSVSNGLGLAQSFSWQLARNNFHGVNGGGPNATNPYYCNNTSVQSTYPCNMPDDGSWSRVVLAQRSETVARLTQAGQGGAQTPTNVTSTAAYTYQVPWPLPAQMCPDCQASFYWGNQNDFDLLDFYNGKFMGFAQTAVSEPDGSVDVHKFLTTEGWGLYDTSKIVCNTNNPCHNDPFSDLANAAHGHEYELDQYDTNGTTLLSQVKTRYQAVCPPTGVGATPASSSYGSWDGNLVTELDHSNPVMVCEAHPLEADRYVFDGSGGVSSHSATTYAYDSLGRVSSRAEVSDSGRTSVADASGHGSSAARSGGVTEGIPGLIGDSDTATSFDGSSGYVQLPSSVFGSYPTSGSTTAYSLSFETWFRTTTGGVILGQTGGGTPPASSPGGWVPAIYVDTTGALRESLFWPSPAQNVASGRYNDGRPHHVVATYAGGVDSLYVDGQLVKTASYAEGGYSGSYRYFLGTGYTSGWAGTNGSWFFFDGTLDEAAVYGSALSSAQVQAHYNAGANYKSVVLADSPNAYWLDDGGPSVSPSTALYRQQYVQNDSVTAAASSATGTYIVDRQAFDDVEDLSGSRYSCGYTSYDGQGFATGQTGALTRGLATAADRYTSCGTSSNGFAPSGQVRATHTYDAFGNQLTANDPDANAGNTAHQGCTVAGATYSACTAYDGTFSVLPTSSANALNQTSTVGYQPPAGGTASGGFGLWPISMADANGQITTVTYDALGRETSKTLPGETAGLTTVGTAYAVWCSGAGAQSPCAEVDRTQRLNSTTTVTARAFYDGFGHQVEARSPAPNGQDVVRYRYYDPSQRLLFESVPYLVPAYAGAPGAAAYSIPDSTQAGASYAYDGLGRQTSETDALSNRASTSRNVVCGPAGTGDTACYEQTLTIDPNGHQGGGVADPLGRITYEQRYTGNSPATYAVYATTRYTYDFLGNLAQALHPNGTTQTAFQYDMAGRKTGMTDPDRGTETYAYDQDGNPVQSVDARGGAGTIFMGYDGLSRPIWRNTTNSPTGAYDTYTYDSAANGNLGIGRLTGESFAGAAGSLLSGSYGYFYDSRGRQTSSTLTVGFASGLGAPTGVTAVAGNAQATVSWAAPAANGGSAIGGYTVTASPGAQTASVGGSSTSATVTGLANGAAYTFTVTAANGMGTGPASAASNSAIPATVPGAPTGVTAVAGNGQATVSWAAPAADGGSTISGYTVTASPGGARVTVGGTSTSAVSGGLANGTAYTFTVAAGSTMGAGGASPASNSVTPAATAGPARDQVSPLGHASASTSVSTTFVTNPQAASKLVVAVWEWDASAPTSITDNASPANAYTLDRSVTDATVPIGLFIYRADNPHLPATGGLQVTATFASSTDRDIGAISYTGLAAGGPEQSQANTGSGTTPSSGAAGISNGDVYVAAMAEASGSIDDGVTTSSPFTQQIVEQDGASFEVGAVSDLVGASAAQACGWTINSSVAWVAAIAAYAPAAATVPGAPTVAAAVAGSGQATVSWAPPASSGGSAITGYTVTATPGGQTATVGGSTTTATVNGLGNGTAYTFAATATNSAGAGPASAASNSVTPATVPAAPTGLTVVAGNAQAAVSWAAPVANGGSAISGYTVTASPGGQTASVGGGTTTATVSGLGNGTAYTFTAMASNALGTGPASAASNSVTPAAPPVYQTQTAYDDAGNVLTETYPTGETVANSYTGEGWLSGVSTAQGGVTTALASGIGYTGAGGAFGEVTAMHLGGGYDSSASYDALGRPADLKVRRTSDGSTLFEQTRTFDAAGDVATASTTLPGGSDNQAFCYDEQDRLTWAGSMGTPPCTGAAITVGTLTAAQYTQSFTYDTMGRLASGPLGSYAYGDPAHVHAATAAGVGYTASYDAAGDMACRAPTSASTCGGGTPNGAQLSYNNEGELSAWQSAPASPATTAGFLYDGQGERVIQQVTTGTSTATTVYVGDVEEVSTSGSTTTTTTYYYAGGRRIALRAGGTISYLASDALGSSSVTLNGSGTATASQLFAPYGSVRYSSGTMPTSFGFTGQRDDAATGLGYLHARYLDPVLGQFASADKLLQGGGFDILGLSRYAYVEGNPIGRTDPTGHRVCENDYTCDGAGGIAASSDPGPAFPFGPADPCGGWCTPAPYHAPVNFRAPATQGAPAPTPRPTPAPRPAPAPRPPDALHSERSDLLSGLASLWNGVVQLLAPPPEQCEPDGPCSSSIVGLRGGIDGSSRGNLKRVSRQEAKLLDAAGENPEDVKGEVVGRGSQVKLYDLFKDQQGNVWVLPKSGQGEPQATGIRIRAGNVEYVSPTELIDPVDVDPLIP